MPRIDTFSPLVHLERLGSLSEDTVRFYVAELASALSFLHEKRIMHRCVVLAFPLRFLPLTLASIERSDIKPDNILLDENGHAHLTDFNIAVHFSDRRMLTGVAGSMAYMAPEILTKRGYTYPIDWWSLGVCAYELIFGRRPFRGRTNTALTQSISKDSLRFPENAESKCSKDGMRAIKGVRLSFSVAPHDCGKTTDCSDLLQFLDRDPWKRLACSPKGESMEEIQQHPWFAGIDWDKLTQKALPSPFVPDVRPKLSHPPIPPLTFVPCL